MGIHSICRSLVWLGLKKTQHIPTFLLTSAFLDIPMQNSMSRQQIITMMQDCIWTYIPLQSPSSSFYVWYHHFPSLGLTKQLISLSLLFVHNKTQSTEAKKKLENKSKELLIFLSHIHVAHTIKPKHPKEESRCFSSCQSIKHKDSPNISHIITRKTAAFTRGHYQALFWNNLPNSATLPQQTSLLYSLTYFEAIHQIFLKLHNCMNLTLKFSQPLEKTGKKY